MAKATPTFLASFGLTGLRALAQRGLDVDAFVRELRLPQPVPQRLPSRTLDVAIALALEWTGESSFGLEAGVCWHPSDLGAVGYAWLSSDSLRTGLQRMARYQQVLGQRMAARCFDTSDGLCFEYSHGRGDSEVGRAMARFELSVLAAMVRLNLGADARALQVQLRQPEPADPRPFEDCFLAPVRFGAARDAMLFATEDADRPLATAQRELARVFDEHLSRELAALDPAQWVARCSAWLLERLTSGEPTEIELARAMAMSPRTLQRRLREEGSGYREVLARTRYGLAKRYLDDPTRSVTEIAFLLGFSEQSAFTRAFRRWGGQSPGAYRRSRSS